MRRTFWRGLTRFLFNKCKRECTGLRRAQSSREAPVPARIFTRSIIRVRRGGANERRKDQGRQQCLPHREHLSRAISNISAAIVSGAGAFEQEADALAGGRGEAGHFFFGEQTVSLDARQFQEGGGAAQVIEGGGQFLVSTAE